MTALTLTIGEIRVEGAAVEPEVLRRALETALGTLARQLQARAAGRAAPAALSLPDLTVRLPQATPTLAAPGVEQLVAAILAAVTARLEGAP